MSEQPIRQIIANSVVRHGLAPVMTLWFDGACEPKNPGGVATCGWVIRDSNSELLASGKREVARGEGATNNVAEWTALGLGLRWMLDNHQVTSKCVLGIRGDSKLVVEQLNRNWKCNAPHLLKLRDRCLAILEELGPTSWTAKWIPREENEEADLLSQQAYEEATGKAFPVRVRR